MPVMASLAPFEEAVYPVKTSQILWSKWCRNLIFSKDNTYLYRKALRCVLPSGVYSTGMTPSVRASNDHMNAFNITLWYLSKHLPRYSLGEALQASACLSLDLSSLEILPRGHTRTCVHDQSSRKWTWCRNIRNHVEVTSAWCEKFLLDVTPNILNTPSGVLISTLPILQTL